MNVKKVEWSRPGSNRGPSACKADVITTTPRDQLLPSPLVKDLTGNDVVPIR